MNYYYYIHLTAFFQDNLGKPAPERYKPFWILLEQEMMGRQWHQLDHMQIICTFLQTDNHISTSSLSFYRPDAVPATQLYSNEGRRNSVLGAVIDNLYLPYNGSKRRKIT